MAEPPNTPPQPQSLLGKKEIAVIIAVLTLLGVDVGTSFAPSDTDKRIQEMQREIQEQVEPLKQDMTEIKVSIGELKTELRMTRHNSYPTPAQP